MAAYELIKYVNPIHWHDSDADTVQLHLLAALSSAAFDFEGLLAAYLPKLLHAVEELCHPWLAAAGEGSGGANSKIRRLKSVRVEMMKDFCGGDMLVHEVHPQVRALTLAVLVFVSVLRAGTRH